MSNENQINKRANYAHSRKVGELKKSQLNPVKIKKEKLKFYLNRDESSNIFERVTTILRKTCFEIDDKDYLVFNYLFDSKANTVRFIFNLYTKNFLQLVLETMVINVDTDRNSYIKQNFNTSFLVNSSNLQSLSEKFKVENDNSILMNIFKLIVKDLYCKLVNKEVTDEILTKCFEDIQTNRNIWKCI